jgi:hypothetical protein
MGAHHACYWHQPRRNLCLQAGRHAAAPGRSQLSLTLPDSHAPACLHACRCVGPFTGAPPPAAGRRAGHVQAARAVRAATAQRDAAPLPAQRGQLPGCLPAAAAWLPRGAAAGACAAACAGAARCAVAAGAFRGGGRQCGDAGPGAAGGSYRSFARIARCQGSLGADPCLANPAPEAALAQSLPEAHGINANRTSLDPPHMSTPRFYPPALPAGALIGPAPRGAGARPRLRQPCAPAPRACQGAARCRARNGGSAAWRRRPGGGGGDGGAQEQGGWRRRSGAGRG